MILWDFDGTLGYREGGWTGAILQALSGHGDLSGRQRDDIRPFLQSGYPWHEPSIPHTHIETADEWWGDLYPVFERVFIQLGGPSALASAFAKEVRAHYLAPHSWRIYDDVRDALKYLSEAGWTHRVLSNHVPELGEIVGHVGLNSLMESVFTSGVTGYEKPHPEAFRIATKGVEADVVWMVGDSFTADYEGAGKMGIPSILVRKPDVRADLFAESLHDIPAIIGYGLDEFSSAD